MAGAQTFPVRAANSQPASAVTPLAQIKVGRFTVTALSDGYADMPYGYFPGRTPEQVETAAKAQFAARSSGVRFLFNQYLVKNESSRILIDAGPAGTLGQTGYLSQALAARGLSPDQIDAVIVTHMHQDHLGGLVAGGRRIFPKAEVYVDRRDIAHWTDPGKQAAAPDYLHSSSASRLTLFAFIRGSRPLRATIRSPAACHLSTLRGIPQPRWHADEDGGQSLMMVV